MLAGLRRRRARRPCARLVERPECALCDGPLGPDHAVVFVGAVEDRNERGALLVALRFVHDAHLN